MKPTIIVLILISAFVSCTPTTETEKLTTEKASSVSDEAPTLEHAPAQTEEQTTTKLAEIEANSAPITAQTPYDDGIALPPDGSMTVMNSYVIIQSTKSYSAAMFTAKEASTKLDQKLNLRGYVFDFKKGLKDTSICGCGEVHDYIPRGRYDDGTYVSIEHTNSFKEFTDGYYIVVTASGKRKSLKPLLFAAQVHYTDAYIKNATVYIGCMH